MVTEFYIFILADGSHFSKKDIHNDTEFFF